MHEESQSGDGLHPLAVGSAHHIVKQSEGHWWAAEASVLSTFIAVASFSTFFLFVCFFVIFVSVFVFCVFSIS